MTLRDFSPDIEAILADAGLKARGLHKRHAMTTLLPSYEFGKPLPQYHSELNCPGPRSPPFGTLAAHSCYTSALFHRLTGASIAGKSPVMAE